ncbi:hypothetical protein HU200_018510 [Digitaria exilis]|uniref:Homeobox domain-containing protein n=1 Tax=Digitaria exilis TaxID=1010633 RepID=A0A835F491_9POAL|nr:hypothetical protein HU200_018510 [Digitaria exilis]
MAHDPSLAYADYFAAAAGGVSTLVPEVVDAGDDDAGDHLHLYGGGVQAHHQHGLDMFGVRGLMPVGAHGKAAALGEFALAEHHHHLGGHNNQAPLMTSLSLHGPADAAAALALHHHHQQLGTLGLHQPAEWPQQQMQMQHGAAGWHLRGSRFLRPTQQLLQEFCSLPVEDASNSKPPTTTTKPASEDGGGAGEASSSPPPSAQIQAMDAAELQRLKAKLYAMLQEVRYPSDVDKHILARQTGLSRSQVSNWFINARVRLWKPMVEEMYNEEMKDPQEGSCSNANNNNASVNPSSYSTASELGQGRGGGGGGGEEGGERKPTPAQLVVHDAGSLASVVSIGSSRDPQNINFGSMMDGHLDFGAYNDDHHHGFGAATATGGGVSLTLGLQQHGDDPHGGVNVAFAAGATSSAAHEFLFMAGGEQQQQQMVAGGGVHHGQFVGAGMEGDAVTASHYHRGLSAAATGFQLLHDLAG